MKRAATTPDRLALVRAPDEIIAIAVRRAVGSCVVSTDRPPAALFNDIVTAHTDDDRQLIVRVRRGEARHFDAEAWAIARATEAGVPAPTVLAVFDQEADGDLWSVCVEEKAPGDNLQDLLALPFGAVPDLASSLRELGRHVRMLHSVRPSGFGPIGHDSRGHYRDWDAALRLTPPEGVDDRCTRSGVDPRAVERARHLLNDAIGNLRGMQPALLHGDFVSDQVLIDDGTVSAILDFEHPRSGDPMWDLAYWSYNNRHPDALDAIIDGYTDGSGLNDDQTRRLQLARLWLSVDWIYRSPTPLAGRVGAFILQRFDDDYDYLVATSSPSNPWVPTRVPSTPSATTIRPELSPDSTGSHVDRSR